MRHFGRLLLLCLVLPCVVPLPSSRGAETGHTNLPRVFLFDPGYMHATRERIRSGDKTFAPALTRLERDAKEDLTAGPFSVMTKDKLPPSGDKHDFMSQAPYYWPDTNSPDGLP